MAEGGPQRIEVSPRTFVYAVITLAAVWLAVQLWNVFVVVLVALVIVGTVDPVVGWFERHGWRRGRALILIFFVLAGILSAIILLTVPPLVSQLQHIIDIAPHEQRRLASWLSEYPWAKSIASAIRGVKLDDMMLRAGNALINYSSELLTGVGYAVTTLFLAIYLLADPRRAKGALFAIVPRHQHVKLARILLELTTIVGGYMRGQLITSVAITVFTFGLMTIFKINDALAIAMFAGLTDVIPFIGGYLASGPAILAVSGSGSSMAIVAVAMFAYQEFESRVLVPRVYGRTLRLPPAVVLIALLIGGTLLGILGALLALPVAAGAQMIVRQLRVDLPGEDEAAQTESRARDEKAGHMYEILAHDQPLQEAAVIAGELAQRLKETEDRRGSMTDEMPVIMKELGEDKPTGES
jgi:predicted PurR-regulated permease PerM